MVDWIHGWIRFLRISERIDSTSKGNFAMDQKAISDRMITLSIFFFFMFQHLNRFACTISSIAMLLVIFANYPFQQPDSNISPLYYGLNDTLSRVIWSIALCYIIFACVHNSTSLVNRFLSHHAWHPISRLSFAIYLVHPMVLVISLSSLKTPLYFNEMLFLRDFIGNCLISIAVAVVASLAFESPIVNIEKLIFRSGKKSESSKKTD